MGFRGNLFARDPHELRLVPEFGRSEVGAGVMSQAVRRAQVRVYPYHTKGFPRVFCRQRGEESSSLKRRPGIYDMQYRFSVEIHDVGDDLIVEAIHGFGIP
jgi:hypothetical protein